MGLHVVQCFFFFSFLMELLYGLIRCQISLERRKNENVFFQKHVTAFYERLENIRQHKKKKGGLFNEMTTSKEVTKGDIIYGNNLRQHFIHIKVLS